jgi:two-component system, chemotaxis family, protein-glutamate methylesterase/glutaminase
MTRKIKVLVIDDSAVARQLLSSHLARDPAIEVVGTAADPYVAWEKMRTLDPDVLTLDIEMPRMDGITFLEKLMRRHPIRVLMVSSLTDAGCATTLRALELGAIDFVTKPLVGLRERFPELAQELTEKVKMAAAARLPAPRTAPALRRLRSVGAMRTTQRIIAIGASTGGTEAIREFLTVLPADAPGIVIVQHMPEKFTRGFAARLDGLCAVRVKEAEDGDRALAGHVLVAPGNRHMRLVRDGAVYVVHLSDEPHVNRHRPSVDVLFHSCAQAAGANAVGIIMTGMGADGARGLLAMRQAGAATLAQDEASCVVFGMPRTAIDLGAAELVVPLGWLADTALARAQDAPAATHVRGT